MTEIQTKLAEGLNQLLDKQPELLKADAYYSGTMTEIYSSPEVKKALKKSGTWSLNYSHIPCEAVTNRLNVLKVSSDASRATKLLEQVDLRNNFTITIAEIVSNTVKFGHSYASVAMSSGNIDIYALSPLSTHVVYETDKPREAAYAVRLWEESSGTVTYYRANLYTPDYIYRFRSDQMPTRVQPDTFSLIGKSPSPGIPIIEFATGMTKQPEHAPGYAVQDALTKAYTAQMAAVDYASFPIRVALSDVEQTNDFDDERIESALSTHPGQVTLFSGFKSVQQLNPLEPSHYQEPLNHLIRQMGMLTQTPLTHFADWMKSNVSGEGTRATESAFYAKCRSRQAYIDRSLKQLFAYVLMLKNLSGNVVIEWQNVESTDKNELWSWRFKAVQAGLPIEQMLIDAGYDKELVNKWKAEGLLIQSDSNDMPQPTPSNKNVTEKDDNNNGNE